MSKEKIVLSIIAILLGLFVAGGAFYIYQMTRTINEPGGTLLPAAQTPTTIPENSNFLVVQEPKDEEVMNKRLITVKGKTIPGSTVIISSAVSDQVVEPNANGDFSLTYSVDDGVNILTIVSIFPNGEEQTVTRTVTSTTEEF